MQARQTQQQQINNHSMKGDASKKYSLQQSPKWTEREEEGRDFIYACIGALRTVVCLVCRWDGGDSNNTKVVEGKKKT